jgi:hypothetical protein
MPEQFQKKMIAFHDAIKLDDADNVVLRQKRDLLSDEIRNYLKSKFPTNTPTFKVVNQGSYAMGTGVLPLEGENYDIDVALEFNINKANYTNPVDVKKWIYDALNKNNRNIEWKRPCISVNYAAGFHVDLAAFSVNNQDSKKYIARGYEHSGSDNREWLESDPLALITCIDNKFKNWGGETISEGKQQFKRVIRYLKRWKDVTFNSAGNNRPFGIALTACALKWFTPQRDKDMSALSYLVKQMVDNFETRKKERIIRDYYKCLSIELPIAPSNNLFGKMSETQQQFFYDKLLVLHNTLLEIRTTSVDLNYSCRLLHNILGKDFPI